MNTSSQALMNSVKNITAPKKAASAKAEEKFVAVDKILEVVETAENLSKEEAYAQVTELLGSVDFNYFKLGGALAVIQSHEWWKDDGYETFRAFIEGRFGLHYRKAMYLISIYVSLADSGVSWASVSSVGWTKLKELASIINPENVDEWVAKAKNMTTLQLQAAIAQYKASLLGPAVGGGEAPEDTSGITTVTFKVHADQKETIKQAVEKARAEMNTEYDAVALEGVCMNYLAGAKVTKPKSLKAMLKDYEPRDIIEAFNEVFPHVAITIDMN